MKNITLLISLILFLGCTNINKRYTYIETTNIEDKEPKIIYAQSDSLAYIEAYTNFCISKAVYNKMMDKSGGSDLIQKPLMFQLIKEDGSLVLESTFENISIALDSVKRRFLGIEKSKVDSVKIQELLQFFDIEKDKFSPQGISWYLPKGRPKYINSNGIYCYFATNAEGSPYNLRLKIQYAADDWLFIKSIYFSINGKAYKYSPEKVERDHDGRIWEWSDEGINYVSKNILIDLIQQDYAEMKLDGSHYYKVKKISKEQIQSIKRTIELYKAMGGEF